MKLISASSIYDAKRTAADMGLSQHEWSYVPSNPADPMYRLEKIMGQRCKKEDLIGPFDDEEIFYLTGEKAS